MRDNPAYNVSGGNLNITTELGDIYTGDTNPPPNNFILQSADHAGADWVIETKLSSTITDGYAQGGLIAYVDGDNYVKFDAISDTGNTRSTASSCARRWRVRSRTRRRPTRVVAAGTTNIWLRLKKAGTTYSGEYSFDGTTWTAVATTTPNTMQAPKFGLFSFGPQAAGRRRRHVVRLLHARRAGPARRRVRLQRPGRRVRRDRARRREVGRDRPAGRHEGQARGRQAEGHHRPRRHLHQRRRVGDAELPPAEARQGGLRPRDQGRRHAAQRRLRPGRHPGPHRRRQLREVRRDLRRRQPEVQPDRAALRAGRRDPEPAAAGDRRASRPPSPTCGCA